MRGRLATGDEWWRPLPQGASPDALRVLAARGVRAFGDGFVALLLPIYLVELGFDALAIGTIFTGTLIGTALMTLWVGWVANRHSRRLLLLAAATLMIATGVGFSATTEFWPLLLIAVVGTMNPTSGATRAFLSRSNRLCSQKPLSRGGAPRSSPVTASSAPVQRRLACSLPHFPISQRRGPGAADRRPCS
jgi:MFS family permease